MPAATLLLLVSVDIDPLDVDADEAARAVLDVESRVRSALEKRRVRMGGVSHVIVKIFLIVRRNILRSP
jgi:hypothetical protein